MNQKQKLFFFSVSGSDNTANFSWLKVSLDPFPTSKLFRARVKNVVLLSGANSPWISVHAPNQPQSCCSKDAKDQISGCFANISSQ